MKPEPDPIKIRIISSAEGSMAEAKYQVTVTLTLGRLQYMPSRANVFFLVGMVRVLGRSRGGPELDSRDSRLGDSLCSIGIFYTLILIVWSGVF